jgi:hypothetical protein
MIRDDGSKNTNYGFIKNISNKYNISILVDDKNDENIGSVKSYNRLLGQSQSDYICFSDQDDVWKKDKLFHSFKRMKIWKRNMVPIRLFWCIPIFRYATITFKKFILHLLLTKN